MEMRKTSGIIAYTCLIALVCSSYPVLAEHVKVRDKQQFSQELQELQTSLDIPAMAVLVVDTKTNIFFQVSGYADKKSLRRADADTVFRIGSITKMFTSLAILILQEKRALSLGMKLRSLVPGISVRNDWQKNHPITLAQLLEHTSGLAGLSRREMNYEHPLPIEQALALNAASRATQWPPGHHYSYSNLNAGLAELVIEKVSGTNYEQFLKEYLFTPLNMYSASINYDDKTKSRLATGYDSDGYSPIPYWHVLFRGFGAINIKAADMSPFLRFLLNKGTHKGERLLQESSIKRMETPSTSLAAKNGLSFGYGLGNYQSMRQGWVFHGHGGDADGYLSRIAYNRELELAYFIVINTFKNDALEKIRAKVENFIIAGRTRAEPDIFRLDAGSLATITGQYQQITYRFPATPKVLKSANIVNKDGKLVLNVSKNQFQLIPVSNSQFRGVGQTLATSALVKDSVGGVYFQHSQGNFKKISD